jgi:Zn-dependent peptidase ImmA (M78 family)
LRIPTKFELKGKVWRVKYKPNLSFGDTPCDGLCNFGKRTIYLERSLPKDARQATFLHELFHALIFEAHVAPGTRFSEGVEEVLCEAFADVMTTMFTLKWRRQRASK